MALPTVNYFHPGNIKSSLLRHLKDHGSYHAPMTSPTEVSADRVARLAISSEFEGITETYLVEDKIQPLHKEAVNPKENISKAQQERYWPNGPNKQVKKMKHFKTLSAYLEYMQLLRPEHPMLSVMTAKGDSFLPCPRESSPPISNDCYSISLKKTVKGNLNYGRTKYNFTNGALIFISPRQVIQWDNNVVFEQKAFP